MILHKNLSNCGSKVAMKRVQRKVFLLFMFATVEFVEPAIEPDPPSELLGVEDFFFSFVLLPKVVLLVLLS